MKKLLICGTAMTLLLSAAPVQAQSYSNANNAKDHDNTLGSANYVQPEKQADAAQPAAEEAAVEPAAGYSTGTLKDFSGPYVGADFGYNWARADIDTPAGSLGSANMDGWGGGGFVGYGTTLDMMGGMYLGGELGYDWINAEDDVAGGSVRERNDFRATIRPGWAIDKFLGYGIAGYSRADFRADPGDSKSANGYVVGLGTEFSTGMPIKARLEYTYSGFEHEDVGSVVEIKPRDTEIRVGLLYQFH